ncbi:hypothetical protein DFJ43DRAFT_1000612 [Lentinula guzmanii]|uniref:Uncharacterized protein n=1 Tax=Lentinula guzmanii TaxID=2804957 RepID=A0AA38JK88_9AGAR|nr:hypothetical protein DFJ43DRAFT_1000612 [Lentinula guzmanii]
MPRIPLIIAQYTNSGHRNGPDHKHWAIVALQSQNTADIFELVGNSDTFTYIPRKVTRFSESQRLCGGYIVGTIDLSQVQWLYETLRQVPIHRFHESWDCQSWVLDALLYLRELTQGVVTENIGRAHIQAEMSNEYHRWQYGGQIIQERLFPSDSD